MVTSDLTGSQHFFYELGCYILRFHLSCWFSSQLGSSDHQPNQFDMEIMVKTAAINIPISDGQSNHRPINMFYPKKHQHSNGWLVIFYSWYTHWIQSICCTWTPIFVGSTLPNYLNSTYVRISPKFCWLNMFKPCFWSYVPCSKDGALWSPNHS